MTRDHLPSDSHNVNHTAHASRQARSTSHTVNHGRYLPVRIAGRVGATTRAFLCRSTRRAGHLHRRVTRQPGHTIFHDLRALRPDESYGDQAIAHSVPDPRCGGRSQSPKTRRRREVSRTFRTRRGESVTSTAGVVRGLDELLQFHQFLSGAQRVLGIPHPVMANRARVTHSLLIPWFGLRWSERKVDNNPLVLQFKREQGLLAPKVPDVLLTDA